MKALLTTIGILSCLIFFSFSFCNNTKEDPKEITEFITEMADARMMDREEGQLAAMKGTTAEIQNYGKLMVKDQTYLLEELNNLAMSKNVVLPKEISMEKMKQLKKLQKKEGADFDKKFLSMIKIDHKRDVRKFTKATKFEDETVHKFASKHLPMITSHLEGVQQIKKNS